MSTHSAAASPANDDRRSAMARAVTLLGAAAVVAGVLITLSGLGGVSAFDVAVKSFAFDTTSTGLAVIALGGGLIAGMAAEASAAEREQRRAARIGVTVMALGLMAYVASILF